MRVFAEHTKNIYVFKRGKREHPWVVGYPDYIMNPAGTRPALLNCSNGARYTARYTYPADFGTYTVPRVLDLQPDRTIYSFYTPLQHEFWIIALV
jgi:hypothetical protein